MYFSAIATRHVDAKTLELLAELDGLFGEINEKKDFSNTALNIIGHLGAYFILQLFSVLLYKFFYSDIIYQSYDVYFSLYAPIVTGCVNLLIFRSYVCLLNEYSKGLNRLLLNMLTRPNVGIFMAHHRRAIRNEPLSYRTDYSKRLNILMRIHDRICDCADNINRAHGFRNLVVLTYGFVATVIRLFIAFSISLYWTGRSVETHLIIMYITYYFSYSLVLNAVIRACEDYYNEGKETAAVVNRLVIQEADDKTKLMLLQFSITLLNRPPAFTACGLFILDNSLILRMVSTSATYLIVLCQFAFDFLRVGGSTTEETDFQVPG